MIAIGRYCVFMISVTAMSSPPKFKEATMTATMSSLATITNEGKLLRNDTQNKKTK